MSREDLHRSEILLVIEDEEAQREALAGYLRKRGFHVHTADSGRAGMALVESERVDLILTDYRMPDMDGLAVLTAARALNPEIEVVLLTAYGSVTGAVDAMRQGAFHYLEKPVDLDTLEAVIERALERRHLVSENRLLRARLAEDGARFAGVIALDPAMEEALNVAARAAPSRASILILGESGTGKELVARAVHAASPRRSGPFVAVNCAALSESLMESELFGHEKGAFTGAARQHKGRFEQADGGSLFIDEVGEIPPAAQVKLLRVLQERTFERVGGSEPVPVDVRVIAATNRDLRQMVRDGTFREDLYFRLNVVAVSLPPLRHRRRDIPALIDHFVAHYSEQNGKEMTGVSREAMDLLMRYRYPGNVRELQNAIERAVVMARDPVISTRDLPAELAAAPEAEDAAGAAEMRGLPDQVEALERQAIRAALDAAEGVQSRAAERLGITERNLRYKLKKYGYK
ncbi:MAG: sigma-54 dependent transcriptional regulator [Gemmatimonadota bacterium]